MILSIVLISAGSYVAETLLPWWSVGIVAFAVSAWRGQSSASALISGRVG